MALTTAQQVRLRIQDIPTLADTLLYGDGTASSFLLPHRNLTTASAYVPWGVTAWSATGATFNPSGMVSFASVIHRQSSFRVTYTHSTFSDAEIDHFTAVGGDVNGAALEAVQALMFDGLKRASWSSPDGTTYSDTAAIGLLKTIYDTLKHEQALAAAGAGGIAEWAMTQKDW